MKKTMWTSLDDFLYHIVTQILPRCLLIAAIAVIEFLLLLVTMPLLIWRSSYEILLSGALLYSGLFMYVINVLLQKGLGKIAQFKNSPVHWWVFFALGAIASLFLALSPEEYQFYLGYVYALTSYTVYVNLKIGNINIPENWARDSNTKANFVFFFPMLIPIVINTFLLVVF